MFCFLPKGLVVASLSALCAYKPPGVDCQTHMAKGVCALQPSAAGTGVGGALQWGLWAFSKSLIKSSVSQSVSVHIHRFICTYKDTENTE